MKIEKQIKRVKGNQYEAQNGYTKGVNSRTTLQIKVVKVYDKNDTTSGSKEATSSSTSSGRRWVKCHELGHIASDFPNRKVIAFVEEDELMKDEKCDD